MQSPGSDCGCARPPVLKARRGDALDAAFAFRADGGAPIDLTGSEVVVFIGQKAPAAIRKSSADAGSGVTVSPTDGMVMLHLTAAETHDAGAAHSRQAIAVKRVIGGNAVTLAALMIVFAESIADEATA